MISILMRTIGVAMLLVGWGHASVASSAQATEPPVVSTSYGRISGVLQGDSHAYLGLPFAKPPVGDLRWRAPVKADSWTGIRDGSRFPANCYQAEAKRFGPYTPEFMIDSSTVSEDCLYLNVWVPMRGGSALPVLVWIHGGGFGGGSGSIPIYNGARLAAKGAVVVTVNYRVGAFGFLAHPELNAESTDRSSGNFGLLDNIAALEWVQGNISRFGGDPARVTVAGQSAGAMAIEALLHSPQAKGLFSRAITESGTAAGTVLLGLKDAEREGEKLMSLVGTRTLADLRKAPAALILEKSGSGPPQPGVPPGPRLAPTIDGKVILHDPNDPQAAVVVSVPQLSGYNRDEGRGVSLGRTSTPEAFAKSVRDGYGSYADRILAVYPHATEKEATQSGYLLPRDVATITHAIFGQVRTQSTGQPFYAYLFDHVYPGPESALFGAFHTAEVPYVFGVLDQQGRPFDAVDRRISDEIQAYWLNFMRTGNPNGSGLPNWPASRSGLAGGDGAGRQTRRAPCRFRFRPCRCAPRIRQGNGLQGISLAGEQNMRRDWIAGSFALGLAIVSSAGAQSSGTWRDAFQSSPATYAPLTESQLEIPPEILERMRPIGPVTGTFRYRVPVTAGGSMIRVRISNEDRPDALELSSASVGLAADGFVARPGSIMPLKFGGHGSVTVPPDAPVVSDPLTFSTQPGMDLVISVSVPGKILLEQRGSQSLVVAPGDQSLSVELREPTPIVARMIVTGISVLASSGLKVIVAMGDSITDGSRRDLHELRSWPQQLANRLNSRPGGNGYAVVNAGIGGNRVLQPGWGPAALSRLDRDVLRIDGLSHVILLEGINDIGQGGNPRFSTTPAVSAEEIIAGYRQIIARVHERGAKIGFGTLLPFSGAMYATAEKEVVRAAVNTWIETSGEPDFVIDFQKTMADPENQLTMRKEFDSGDHLHPNEAGYRAMGDSIDLALFP